MVLQAWRKVVFWLTFKFMVYQHPQNCWNWYPKKNNNIKTNSGWYDLKIFWKVLTALFSLSTAASAGLLNLNIWLFPSITLSPENKHILIVNLNHTATKRHKENTSRSHINRQEWHQMLYTKCCQALNAWSQDFVCGHENSISYNKREYSDNYDRRNFSKVKYKPSFPILISEQIW